jgi:hypothetical protein
MYYLCRFLFYSEAAGPGRDKAARREKVELRAGEVRIAVAWECICGAALHVYHGDTDARVTIPGTIGHEMSGTIANLGPGVEGWEAGAAVMVMPLAWDGAYPVCRAGNEHICQNLDFIGIDSPGALQQHCNVPASTLVRVPSESRCATPRWSSRSPSPCTMCVAPAGADIIGVPASLDPQPSAIGDRIRELGREFSGHRIDFANGTAVIALAEELAAGDWESRRISKMWNCWKITIRSRGKELVADIIRMPYDVSTPPLGVVNEVD